MTSHPFQILSDKEVIDMKRSRGIMACAESQRRRLECDKKFPCSSCGRWDDGDFESASEEKDSSREDKSFEGTLFVGMDNPVFGGRLKQGDKYPFADGGNSNIYRGTLTRSDGRKIRVCFFTLGCAQLYLDFRQVAIKMLRMSDDGPGQIQDMFRRLEREVDVWSGLKHKNILPLIGVCEDLAPRPVLISPFCKFGHVGKYLSKHPDVSRETLALGIGSGLQFLHANGIVHGDLKVQNVLVDKHGVPCICDFGISKIIGSRGFTTSSVGTAPYMAPELFFVIDEPWTSLQVFDQPSTTTHSDIYSFALLVLEILIAAPPKARPSTPFITTRTRTELRPKRTHYAESMVSRSTWAALDQCWSFEPLFRPTISDALDGLTESFFPIPDPPS